MLRRSLVELSSRGSVRRIPTQITIQIPSYLSSRKEFSVASQQNAPQGSGMTDKPSGWGNVSKIVIGSVALGAAVMTAYQTGYLDKIFVQKPEKAVTVEILKENNEDSPGNAQLGVEISKPSFQQSVILSSNVESAEKNIETRKDHTQPEELSKPQGENEFQIKGTSELTPQGDAEPFQEKELPSSAYNSRISDIESTDSGRSVGESVDVKSPEEKSITGQHEAPSTTPILTAADAVPKENEINSVPPQHLSKDIPEDALGNTMKQSSSLLDEYYLKDKAEEPTTNSLNEHKDLGVAVEDLSDAYVSKDGKLVLDFLQAIHAAEKRQAELDAHIFGEEKRMMKEKYEKELRDARARELMYAEREAILDKELNKERVKAAAALKSLQEKLEEKLKVELEQKESEAELKLQKMQELAKAEVAAAIASEKASQIEKMAEANLNISALCMAFYARSEEARQSHSAHKLALGAVALEDALSNGLPIQKEIEALHKYFEGIDKDSLLDLVLSSLPEETQNHGTDTLLQLNHKFDTLKGTLQHFSLIPPGGGGILAHSLAHVVSWLKVKEVDQSGDGIDSLINRVEGFLAEGKLSEAADTLENGVKGSQAAEIVSDWVRQARNRAITEQALTLLQSYATSISVT